MQTKTQSQNITPEEEKSQKQRTRKEVRQEEAQEGQAEDHSQHLLISHTVDIAIDIASWGCGGRMYGPIDAISEVHKAIKVVVEGGGRR